MCSLILPAMDLTPEGVERMRRSVAMLKPRHASALDRETALAVLDELERLQDGIRRVMVEIRRVTG